MDAESADHYNKNLIECNKCGHSITCWPNFRKKYLPYSNVIDFPPMSAIEGIKSVPSVCVCVILLALSWLNHLRAHLRGSEMHYFNTCGSIQFLKSCAWNPLKPIHFSRESVKELKSVKN